MIKPLNNKVVLTQLLESKETASGIVIAEGKEHKSVGVVLEVADGIELKKGQKVLFRNALVQYKDQMIVDFDDILGIVEE